MSKNSNKITVDNPQKGIAKSPLFGLADMRNIDISDPGIAKINTAPLRIDPPHVAEAFTVIPGWDISAMTYSSKSFSITGQDSAPRGVFFKEDGLKMYILGDSNNTIFQYTLSTAWDISTAVYASKSFSVATQTTHPYDLYFSVNGTKVYITSPANDKIYQYSLSTAWDISTATYDSKNLYVGATDWCDGISFNATGTKMYFVGIYNKKIYQYSLSTAWDISTATYDSKSLALGSTRPYTIRFRPDGLCVFALDNNYNRVEKYSLSTAWDISTGSYVEYLAVGSISINSCGMFLSADGGELYVVDNTNDNIHQYSIPFSNTIVVKKDCFAYDLAGTAKNGNGRPVKLSTTGTLPTGMTSANIVLDTQLQIEKIYSLIYVDDTHFRLHENFPASVGYIQAATNGNNVITGVNTNWTPDMVGKHIQIAVDTIDSPEQKKWYIVSEFISSTQLRLNSSYVGSTFSASTKNYWIGDYTKTNYISLIDSGSGTHTITSVDPGLIKKWASYSNYYFGVDEHYVWKLSAINGEFEILDGNCYWPTYSDKVVDIIVYKNTIFVFNDYSNIINAIALFPYGNGWGWMNDWISIGINPGYRAFPMVSEKGDAMYWCNGSRYVGSLKEVSGKTFSAFDSTTYTFTEYAAKTPYSKRPVFLVDFGSYLNIMTDKKEIYPWDYVNLQVEGSATTIGENYVHCAIAVNQILYIFAGTRGICYLSNGYNAEVAFQIPDYISKGRDVTFGDVVVHRNRLLFSVYCEDSGASSFAGIWSFDTNTGALVLENMVSSGTYGTALSNLVVGGIITDGSSFRYSYLDGTTPKQDIVVLSNPKYSSLKAKIESGIFMIGDTINKGSVQKMIIELAKNLAKDEVIKVSWKSGQNGTATEITTITGGASNPDGFQFDAKITQAKNVQIIIEMGAAKDSTSSPELIYLIGN